MGKRFLGDTPEERADNIAWLKRVGAIIAIAVGFAVLKMQSGF